MVSSTVYKTPTILWSMFHSHEVMEDSSKHDIKCHPSITSIFVRFVLTGKIYEPLQDISQMKIDIILLSTKSYHHHDRLTNLKE